MSFGHKIASAVRRRGACLFARSKIGIPSFPRPIVSITFDDFPRSAFTDGARFIEDCDGRATYYACLGIAGQTISTGRLFLHEDIVDLVSRGHEVGCHTFEHLPAGETPTRTYLKSISDNACAVQRLIPGYKFSSHSYPISYPRIATKRLLRELFICCRTGGQSENTNIADAYYLRSYFLEQGDSTAIERTIFRNAEQNSWLILSTHDIACSPTKYGCSIALFKQVLGWCRASGSELLTVSQTMARIRNFDK